MKNLIWLRTALEVMGFMECDRWNKFNSMADELKRTYKEVQKDMLSANSNKKGHMLRTNGALSPV